MTRIKHEKASPNVLCLIEVLASHQARYIIVGSVAAQLYGAEVQPGDFDIVPALELDNLTRLGNFDVVPELVGDYETLMQRARKMKVQGQEVWVTHVDELLAALTIPRRQKDVSRVRQLREIQRRLME